MTSRFVSLFSFLLILGLFTGCSTTLSNMTPAKAYKPGEFQVVGSMAVQGNSNTAASLVSSVKSASEQFGSSGEITEEQYRQWLDDIMILTLFRPSYNPEIMVRFGLTDKILEGMDLGLKTNFSAYKVDLKTQLWESEDAASAVSVSTGYTYNSDFVSSLISWATLTDFTRHDFTLHVAWGREFGDFAKLSVGPHMVGSLVNVEQRLPSDIEARLTPETKSQNPNQLFNDEWIMYMGGNVMGMVGYKYAYVLLDVSVHWMRFKPQVLGEERDFSGTSFSLGGGLSFNYEF